MVLDIDAITFYATPSQFFICQSLAKINIQSILFKNQKSKIFEFGFGTINKISDLNPSGANKNGSFLFNLLTCIHLLVYTLSKTNLV